MVHYGSLDGSYKVKAQLLGHMSASRVALNFCMFPRANGRIIAAIYITGGKDRKTHNHYYKLSKIKATKHFRQLQTEQCWVITLQKFFRKISLARVMQYKAMMPQKIDL